MKKNNLMVIALMLTLLSISAFAQDDAKSKIPDFSNTMRSDVPIEFTWKMEDIYATKSDWEKAKEETFANAEKLLAMKDAWTKTPAEMLAFCKMNDALNMEASKLYSYASHQQNMEISNPEFRQMLGELGFFFSQFGAKMSFVNDHVLALGEEKFDEYLKAEPALEPYAFGFKDIYRQKAHVLNAEQQAIVSMTGLFAGAPSQASGILNNVDLPSPKVTLSDGKEYTLNYPTFSRLRASKNPADRQLVMDAFFANVKQYENTFAVLMDSAMKQHVFTANVQKYENTLKARMDSDNIDPEVYYMTVKMVNEGLPILHRYNTLKKNLLGLETFNYADNYASAVAKIDKEYSWDEGADLVMKAMTPLGEEYVAGLQRAFDERWIDRYPNKDKQSGAYSGGPAFIHPYVKMNYTGDFNNVSTLAHELGHAMHSFLSNKTQPFALTGYTTFLAEMASTFNEHMLIDYLIETETDDLLKLYILDNYLAGAKGTIYRQTQFAQFELEMHQMAEKGQALTAQWLNNRYLEITRDYYGHEAGVTNVDEYIQSEWAVIPHFFMNYYVINYTTGMISSMALNEMVKADGEDGAKRYLEFLSAGGSDYSLNILKRAGVDMTTEAPYKAAFSRLDRIVSEMENIVKRLKANGKL